ncbi:MAG: HNH endonuclease [Candidatus Methylacidiphilales bacterium]
MNMALDSSVLVLNRLWQAVNICSARRAFSLIYSGQAQVVDAESGSYQTFNFDQWKDFTSSDHGTDSIQTLNFRIRVPKIIVLLVFDRLPRKEIKLTRQNIFLRDRFQCQYCGNKFDRSDLNIDHVVPRARGGKTTWENVVCSCVKCNTKKGNRTPELAHMPLVRKPKAPKPRAFLSITMTRVPHESWKTFVDVAYWNVELSD